MKKTILATTLLTVSAAAFADRFIMTKPEFLLQAGGSISNDDNSTVAVRFSGQEVRCYGARFCFNPSLTFLVTDDKSVPDGDNEFNDKFNAGIGFDVKYKFPKKRNNALYVEAGPVAFIKTLTDYGNDKINLHAGAGVEYRRFIVSIDAYGTKSPLYMLTGGYRF